MIATARKPDVIQAKGEGSISIWAVAAPAGVRYVCHLLCHAQKPCISGLKRSVATICSHTPFILLYWLSDVSGCIAAGNFQVKQLDVTDDAAIQKCIADTIKEHGRLDVLVNNAGYGTEKNVEQADALRSPDTAHDSK